MVSCQQAAIVTSTRGRHWVPFLSETNLTFKKERKEDRKKADSQKEGERKKERLVELTVHRSLRAGPSCPLCMVGCGVGDVNP